MPLAHRTVPKITRYTGLMVLGRLLKGRRIIDCGCGKGDWLHVLRRYLEPSLLVGVDFDFFKLREARAVDADAHYVLSDLEALAIGEGMFDYFFCVETLEHIHQRDNHDAFNSIRGVLVEGGKLLVSTPGNREHCMGGSAHCQFLSWRNLGKSLAGNGFRLLAKAVYYKYKKVPTARPYNFSNLLVFEKGG